MLDNLKMVIYNQIRTVRFSIFWDLRRGFRCKLRATKKENKR